MSRKAVFLDRDGVINKEKHYLHKIEDFEFVDGVFKACEHFQKKGYDIVIITNQSGIGRGYYTEEDYQRLTEWMLEQFANNGINIVAVFQCPHTPESNCTCRKPKPGMFLQAIEKFNIEPLQSWVIGDRERDLQAGVAAGIKNTILVKSGHRVDAKPPIARFLLNSIAETIDVIQ